MEDNQKNKIVMNLLIFLGILVLGFILICIMYYFFVKNSNIKINISTDKKVEYVTINGQKKLLASQKYISDLGYTMRYNVEEFKVLKYKNKDIYKNLKDEKLLITVEKPNAPLNCSVKNEDYEYNKCFLKIDNYNQEYNISSQNRFFKIIIKSSGFDNLNKETEEDINWMINSFRLNL